MNKEKPTSKTKSPPRGFRGYLESKGTSKKVIEVHYRHLAYFLNWCEEENIESEYATYNEILSYIKYLKKRSIKQKTLQNYINSLKHYFSWHIQLETIAENPTRNIDIKGIQRRYLYHLFKKQELESLYHNFKITEPENNPNKNQNWFKTSVEVSKRDKVILGLMIWQGLDTSELSHLTEKDLKLREGKIYIAGTRRSNERELKLESVQILDLMEYTLQVRPALLKLKQSKECHPELVEGQLFVSTGESDKFSNIMQKLMQKLKAQNPQIEKLQQIRASVITGWLKNYNLREVQYRAGHRYVSSTEAYLINDLDDLQEDIGKFHPIG